jgi:hypothetical protein
VRGGKVIFAHDYVRQTTEVMFFFEGRTRAEVEADERRGQLGAFAVRQRGEKRLQQFNARLARCFQIKFLALSYGERAADSDDVDLEAMRDAQYSMTFHQRMAGIRPAVSVAVRLGPFDQRKNSAHPDPCVVMPDRRRVLVIHPILGRFLAFSFDFAFNSLRGPSYKRHATQETIHNSLGVNVPAYVADGGNVVLAAFGQTGSGKSYTMFGLAEEKERGLIPRIVEDLIAILNEKVVVVVVAAAFFKMNDNGNFDDDDDGDENLISISGKAL